MTHTFLKVMAENNNEDQHNAYNNIHNRNIQNNDSTQSGDYPLNVVRQEPDIGLGNRTQHQEDRIRRNENSQCRREESSISFRHFLQNDAGLSSSNPYPDIYSCSRQDRQNIDVSVMDPDSPDLPDFVQDHLAVEHIYFNNDSHSITNAQNLPDFASCVPRNPSNEIQIQQQLDNESEMNAGAALPFDLTTQANVTNSCSEMQSPVETSDLTNSGGRLPDFLSDGHILGHTNPRYRDLGISENNSNSDTFTERHNLITMLRQENNRLRDELSVLQSTLMKKDDRIKELEDLVMVLEISKLQMSSDANTQTMEKAVVTEEVANLKEELRSSKNEILKLRKEKLNTFVEQCQKNVSEDKQKDGIHLALKVKEMTSTSERLLRELLKIITNMQADINNDISNVSVSSSANNKTEDKSNDVNQSAKSD